MAKNNVIGKFEFFLILNNNLERVIQMNDKGTWISNFVKFINKNFIVFHQNGLSVQKFERAGYQNYLTEVFRFPDDSESEHIYRQKLKQIFSN